MRFWPVVLLSMSTLQASVVGRSIAAPSLTQQRVNATLPVAGRADWAHYLERSAAQMAADKATLANERKGLAVIPPLPKQSNSARSIPIRREPAFYAGAEARRIGDTILSFQTPAGGWSKNLDMTGPPRAIGQSFATGNLAPVASGPGDFDEAADETWHYVGTLDNDATNTELHFLAELATALPGPEGDKFRASFLRGIDYLLHAQFPNGGWPQVWPLEGGYHDAITFNDDAVTESAALLRDVATGGRVEELSNEEEALAAIQRPAVTCAGCTPHAFADFAFVPLATRTRARAAVVRAQACILRTQVRTARGLTVWAQQHDALTLRPVAGRNFEPAALSAGESASVLEYLMTITTPSPAVVQAVHAAAAWFAAHQVVGFVWSGGRSTPGGRSLKPQPGAAPLWARYYSVETERPIFGDRDKSIHDDVSEISLERRNGYGWYGQEPATALKIYTAWAKQHPPPSSR